MMPRPKHEPTEANRQVVKQYAMMGVTQDELARVLGIDAKTLRLYYRDELDLSTIKANVAIGGSLFNKAKSGDTASMIFWMKTRAGWREKQDINLVSEDGSMSPAPKYDFSKLTSDELETLTVLLEKSAVDDTGV